MMMKERKSKFWRRCFYHVQAPAYVQHNVIIQNLYYYNIITIADFIVYNYCRQAYTEYEYNISVRV